MDKFKYRLLKEVMYIEYYKTKSLNDAFMWAVETTKDFHLSYAVACDMASEMPHAPQVYTELQLAAGKAGIYG